MADETGTWFEIMFADTISVLGDGLYYEKSNIAALFRLNVDVAVPAVL